MNKRSVGDVYEKVAADFLEENGYQILQKNYRCRLGEIDIIAYDNSSNNIYLTFIEVKYRESLKYGSPLEAIDRRKQKTIIKVSEYYMIKNGISSDSKIRYDVVGILGNSIQIVKNAFGGF